MLNEVKHLGLNKRVLRNLTEILRSLRSLTRRVLFEQNDNIKKMSSRAQRLGTVPEGECDLSRFITINLRRCHPERSEGSRPKQKGFC
jgi:hypothetical protein